MLKIYIFVVLSSLYLINRVLLLLRYLIFRAKSPVGELIPGLLMFSRLIKIYSNLVFAIVYHPFFSQNTWSHCSNDRCKYHDYKVKLAMEIATLSNFSKSWQLFSKNGHFLSNFFPNFEQLVDRPIGLHLIWSLWLHTSHESEFVRDFKEGLGSFLKALQKDEFSKKKSPFLEASRLEE